MKVTGFSFIRNGQKFDYPFVEAIQSILPLCDDFVVAVGKSDDNTLELVKQIDPTKIRIVETVWDDSLREGGKVLAVETDKAFKAISPDTDWCFYIQGDEVVHEKYHPEIKTAMEKWINQPKVDGLLFNYKHFYGSYDYVGSSFKWYPKEIRIVRNNKSIYSYRDAQGFRKGDNEKLRVKPIGAYVHHYGWVKDPRAMQMKQETFNKLWHSDQWVKKNVAKAETFDYSVIDALERFNGSHPQVMEKRILEKNWEFDRDLSLNKLSFKDRFKKFMLRNLGVFIGYKNYELV
ncbi:MAG TPA: glycosyl transferase [Marinilabiliales bacterium]|nr:MAG: glycosyl transferase [Bacteroidetes bacterium GWA2_40_14]OFX56618.1 MAG: glycosyl transferase [Bacteroidetes bacterium GWC2_40_13]OFX71937.1 MAG: glycosyl transferase [Bacteroidetes bacterium GWD2_40_43]OFX94614.1 MAG: glycosyl transferase [Bacteroidetes bacterium GWE2_40_63]OFY22460.1 MAG: glycosyl transferase [Bacteroidetes bacterium GWF2_40_13]OFZ24381.1 MAG: glycosyl transferase [Bacteroidetes bacterium RIFOXYC2_FULL_40_12]HAM98379.1 glycosyl transferase [Marinilabiliales bacteriu